MSGISVANAEARASDEVKSCSVAGEKQRVGGIEQTESPAATPTSPNHQQAEDSLARKNRKDARASKAHERGRAVDNPSGIESARPWTSLREFLNRLRAVDERMNDFREYIKTQRDEGKPLYQWAKYDGYSALSAAVFKLDKATVIIKGMRLPLEGASTIFSQATDLSTSVSQHAAYALGVMNEKTELYLEEMGTSTLSEEAKARANQLITEELKKLMEHSTHATERVWVATDVLRKSAHKSAHSRTWAWSVAGTIMTATIAAVVGIITAHVYGPAGLDLVPMSGAGSVIYNEVLALVQRTYAVTNLTGEFYSIKLEDIDQRYKDLAVLSESHGLRIDNLVDALGPPNENGVYYPSNPKIQTEPCSDTKSDAYKDLDGTAQQMLRLQHDLEQMRKNMNRMDIRLTRSIEKMLKD
ncbi:hypothetical protein FB567DRAFT_596053 [Paraphoma chrysanthemicola]|uniref:Uncharacterized protein n=1 Tax=Paraphoma chrysanthemicola TaxID=798071 RepID=A0A8K0VVM6_9PLEO|nr:hypothetical protein FB567DRAFT_596053 [Paraphoma chrysanthemicola]